VRESTQIRLRWRSKGYTGVSWSDPQLGRLCAERLESLT
jgi:hypothetical protein